MQSGAPIGLRMEAGLWKTRSLSAIGALICLSPNHQVFSAILQCYFTIFHHVSPPVHTWFNHQKVEPKLLTGPSPRTTPRSELTKSEFDVQYGVAWIQNMQIYAAYADGIGHETTLQPGMCCLFLAHH